MRKRTLLVLLVVGLALPGVLAAQVQYQYLTLDLPRVSPSASVMQRVGVTDISVDYHRPAANDREIWGTVVPYGQVWRTGANENTVITFSTDVEVGDQALAAGTYGLHTLPGESEWQVIFSHDSRAWGSFAYDEAKDALRVSATPGTAPHAERFTISFDDVTADSTTMALHWGEVRVPVTISVDATATTLASIRDQLTGLSQFGWQGPNQAASYCLNNEIEDCYEDAVAWAEQAIQAEERFATLSTKAQLLAKTGEQAEADELMARAVDIGNAGALHNYARQLIGQDEKDKALAIFRKNVERHPDTWFVELGLARGFSALGDFDEAAKQMKISLEKAPENQKAYVQGLVDRLEKSEDIN